VRIAAEHLGTIEYYLKLKDVKVAPFFFKQFTEKKGKASKK
jgi:hypothetical protein